MIIKKSILISMLAVFMFFGQSCTHIVSEKEMFNPDAKPVELPAEDLTSRIQRKNIELTMSDGVKIRGWHFVYPNSDKTIMHFLGNAQKITDIQSELLWLAKHFKSDVIAMDYRGYGASQGYPTFDSLGKDVLEIYDWLSKQMDERQKIFAYGYSIGTVFAGIVAANRRVEGTILIAPMTTADDTISYWNRQLPWPQRWMVRLKADDKVRNIHPQPIENVRSIKTRLLVIHGTKDKKISFKSGKAIFENAGSSEKFFCPIDGEDHHILIDQEPALGCLERFIK